MPKLPLLAWLGIAAGVGTVAVVGVLGWLYWLGSQPAPVPLVVTSTPSTVASVTCPDSLWQAPKWEETSLKHFKKGTSIYMGDGDCKAYVGQLMEDAGEFVIVRLPNGKGEGKKKTAIIKQTWVNGDSNYDIKEPLPKAP